MKRELFINGVSVPIGEQGIDYVKEIADISKPDTRQSGYSKSIEIAGTKEVNILFGHIYDINVEAVFDVNKKADAVYYEDSIEQFTGYFRLTEILNNNNIITYKGTLHGELSSIFKDMGDSLISELDWSDLDHDYTEAVIRANWAAYSAPSAGTGYIYPMVDYLGKATLTAYDTWAVTDFRPAVWFLEIWNRIFAKYGYTYNSDFATEGFQFLLMPARSEVLEYTSQEVTDRSFSVGMSGTTTVSQDTYLERTPPLVFNDDSTGAFYNTQTTDYDASTGKWTVSRAGSFNLSAALNLTFEFTGANAPASSNGAYSIQLIRERFGARNILTSRDEVIPVSTAISNGYTYAAGTITLDPLNFDVKKGDVIYFEISDITYSGYYNWDVTLGTASTFASLLTGNVLTVGSNITYANIVPKMKQKDFVMGIIKAFNLYVEDKGQKDLLLKTYDSYYLDNTVDWTNKKNGALRNVPNGELEASSYEFTMATSADYWHGQYKTEVGQEHGDATYTIDNDFQTTTKEIELPFASTIMRIFSDGGSDRPIPTLYGVDKDGNTEQIETKPRMLYFGGFIPCKAWTFVSGTALTLYPYAGTTWQPYGILSSTADLPPAWLLFEKPMVQYYDGTYGTDDMAYGGRTFVDNYETMLSNAQKPVVKASFLLNPMDIYNLSFRDKYFIDTAYFRLLRLSRVGNLYNCEFLKVE